MLHTTRSVVIGVLFLASMGFKSSGGGEVTRGVSSVSPAHAMSCGNCYNKAFLPTAPYDRHYFYNPAHHDDQTDSQALLNLTGESPAPVGLYVGDAMNVHEVSSASTAPKQPCCEEEDGEYGGRFDCQAFNSCHGDTQSGQCTDFHWACDVAPNMQAQFKQTISEPSEARLVQLALALPSRVRAVPERGLVQVLGCTGQVMAQVPVSISTIAQLSRQSARKAT